jgi:large subunit ribosomal protein L3
MGHRRQSAPRHGSLNFMPRKRASHIKGRIRNWLDVEGEPHFLGFAGFKAGMTHIAYIEDQKTSPYFGKELISAVTVIDTPPLVMFGIKIYKRSEYGLRCVGEILSNEFQRELSRKIKIPIKENYNFDEKLKAVKALVDDNSEIRGLFHTEPVKASMPRIKPDILEIKVSGGANGNNKFDFALKHLGKEVRIRECFKEGEIIDVVGVSKGKGFQGPTKRYGTKLLTRKTRGTKRGIGCIGPWKPSRVMYTAARAGQMGFNQRIEYHKRIMRISENGEETNPKGGFVNYGLIKADHLIILGSVPGVKKRLIRLRNTIRPKVKLEASNPTITYINRQSQQRK